MNDRRDRIRWGVLSTSNIGRAAVIPAIRASANGEVVAVASRSGTAARDFADRLEIPGAYGSYAELLADDGIDAVYIPLPNALHEEWTIRAAEAGKHVLCEKPLGMSAEECRRMGRAASAAGVRLMEAFMYRFHPRTELMVSELGSGALGELRLVRSAFTFRLTRPENIRLDPALGGGSLMDVGCYCVNVSRTLVGEEPTRVRAVAERGPTGVDLRMMGSLEFGSGVWAQFDSALDMERREVVEVAGTDGWWSVDGAFLPGHGPVSLAEVRGRGSVVERPIAGADEYQRMVEHFAACILENNSPRYGAEEAARNMAVIEALYRSADEDGVAVRLDSG